MLFILILLVIIALYMVGIYNRLVRKKNMVEEAWSGIDVQLKKRYDLIPNLIETVKGYAKHEQGTLNQVITARNKALNAEGVHAQQEAEKALNTALANVFALSEAYPDLKANQNFLQLQGELSSLEQDIEKARRYYNGTARENNIMIESFPSSIVAKMFNFYQVDFFELDQLDQRNTPKVQF